MRSELTENELDAITGGGFDLATGYPSLPTAAWMQASFERTEILYRSFLQEGLSGRHSISLAASERLKQASLTLLKQFVVESHRVVPVASASYALERVFSIFPRESQFHLLDPEIDILRLLAAEKTAAKPLVHKSVADLIVELEKEAIRIDQSCNVVALSSPRNPTGETLTDDCLFALLDLSSRGRCTLVIDACFSFSQQFTRTLDLTRFSGWVVVWDTGKFLSVGQDKLGFIAASDDLTNEIANSVRLTHYDVSYRLKVLMAELLEGAASFDYRAAVSRISDDNASLMKVELKNWFDIDHLTGFPFALLKLAPGNQQDELSTVYRALWDDARVSFVSGSSFLARQSHNDLPFLRAALLRDPTYFREAVGSVKGFLLNRAGFAGGSNS